MINGGKFSLKYTSSGVFTLLLCTLTLLASGNYHKSTKFYKPFLQVRDTIPVKRDTVPVKRDTIPLKRDTIPQVDTTNKQTDSLRSKFQLIDTLNVKISKDSLDAPVSYAASDSMVLDVHTKKITLYNSANTKYKDLDLTAYKIELDQTSQTVVATYMVDSTGNLVGKPKFLQGESNMDADSIIYNFKTQKGITKSTFTQQGEMFVYGERIKKVNVTDFFALKGRFTTCNLDTPHFAFRTNKMKLVNQKLAVSGPIHPEFEGVPVPIYIPFGFFPLSQGRHSGILPPQFTANEQFGLGLEGLGYYKVLSDMFDMMLRADIYSYGGYRLNLTPTYRKRYRYSGRMNLAYQSTRILSDDPEKEFDVSKSFNIQWSHMADAKARPGTSFQASVNAGSTQYNQFVGVNPTINFQNQLYSSISYSKNWDNKFNLSLNAGHDQNSNSRLINVRLPDGSFTVNNFYPLQQKEFVGEAKWYEKLGIGLNTQFRNQVSFYDSAMSMNQILDTLQWGVQHNIPITLALPSLGPIQVSPGMSYTERWYSSHFDQNWNPALNKVDTSFTKQFSAARDIAFSLGVNTAVFGTYNKFGKNSRVQAIRHVIRPQVSANYKPDLNGKDYKTVQVDSTGRTIRYSKYQGTLYGPFGEGEFGGMSFTLDNNLEMKVRSKKDTTEEGIRKVRLLDGFGVTGSYNFMADSFKLSTFNFYLRSTLFEKVNITASATVDPYKTDRQGYRVDEYAWTGGGFSLGRLTSGNIAISTSFTSQKSTSKEQVSQVQDDLASAALPMTLEEQQAQLNYVRNNPAEFADFDIPWSVNLSYSLSFTRFLKGDYSGYETQISSSINVSGDFNLTPKWKIGANTYYDFQGSSLQQLTMFLSRELHCWQLGINITPVGLYRSFNITINPKSGLLRDLRINRTRYFYTQ
ncbi:putative LPS assembly protein LptD [Flavihumibacter solisilvae]|uniref:Organic solvent tolerance protein OstA n=1 Tax=Flavihumibacter solisilvae TaxID=1349421 RepID=A0A0C1LHN3_9BACT|nr:putative LPS assembly protein LptD [Flavihumibacter solisilvae]KIC94873.1 organic solvent tolerance protein OstA [Flavihumibacter solisilvae]